MRLPASSAATARNRRRALARPAIAAALALSSSVAAAQGAVTLYGGFRGGGDFTDQNASDASVKLDNGAAVSLSYDWALDDGRQAQVFYSFQRSALPGSVANRTSDIAVNIGYLHIGGRVFFDSSHATNGTYLVGGLGITHLSPGLDGLSSEIRPSMNVGLGQQWLLSRQLALRTELRGYLTLVNSNGGFFCSGGACVVKIRGDTLLQVEGLLGLSYAF
jgi:hypothetical protein